MLWLWLSVSFWQRRHGMHKLKDQTNSVDSVCIIVISPASFAIHNRMWKNIQFISMKGCKLMPLPLKYFLVILSHASWFGLFVLLIHNRALRACGIWTHRGWYIGLSSLSKLSFLSVWLEGAFTKQCLSKFRKSLVGNVSIHIIK